jgi:hypothetical protein
LRAGKTTPEAWDSHGSTGRAIEEISEGRDLDARRGQRALLGWQFNVERAERT